MGVALLSGSLLAVVLTVMNFHVIVFSWSNLFGFLFAANGISLLAWGSNRLWQSTVSTMLVDPHSPIGYGTRVPFWYLAGGIGYLVGILLARRHGLLVLFDVPARQLFRFGGTTGCVFEIPLQILAAYRSSASSS
jgi:hypothetical protein